MPFGPMDLFWIGAVPASAAALLMVALRRLRPNTTWLLSVGGGLILGMIAQSVRVGWHTSIEKLLHPHVALDWLPWLVLVATGICTLANHTRSRWQHWLVGLACLFVFVVPLRLLANSVYVATRWSLAEKMGVLALWTVAFATVWRMLSLGQRNGQPILRGGLLIVVAGGTAMTIAASGAITLGEQAGITAATLLGAAAVALMKSLQLRQENSGLDPLADAGSTQVFHPLDIDPSDAAGPLTVMLGGLILLAHYYSELSAANASWLGISLVAAAGWLPEGWPERPVGRGVLRTVLTLLPLGMAVASALAAALADPYR